MSRLPSNSAKACLAYHRTLQRRLGSFGNGIGDSAALCHGTGRQNLHDRWDLRKWGPTSFGKMSLFLGIVFATLLIIHNGVYALFSTTYLASIAIAQPERYTHRLQSFIAMTSVGRQWLELAFSVFFAVLIAWLLTRQKDESGPATVSAEDS